jgi:hypothetical protein
MEMRSLEQPAKMREVALKRPVLALGCSRETPEGVLCLIEKLDPEKQTIGDFTDWDGTRVTLTQSLGQHSRLVFLSPLSLKPLPFSGNTKEMQDAVFFFGNKADAPIQEIAFSPDGLKAAYDHRFIDFGTGSGQLRMGTHGLGFQPAFISDDGRSLYGSSPRRFDVTNKLAGSGPVFEERASKITRGTVVRPIPGTPNDLALHLDSFQQGSYPFVELLKREDESEVTTIGPLWEIERTSNTPQQSMRTELASIHKDKLITVGYRWRELWVRDIGTR